MSDLSIDCPHCGSAFELTAAIRDAVAAPLLDAERKKVDAEVARLIASEGAVIAQQAVATAEATLMAKLEAAEALAAEKDRKLAEAQKAELSLRQERERLAEEKRELDLTVQRRVDIEKKAAVEEATETAAKEFQAKLSDAQSVLAAQNAKLAEAQKGELHARQEREQLAEEKRQLDLTVQRRVDEQVKAAAARATESVAKELGAKLHAAEVLAAEKDAKVARAQQAELAALKAKREAEDAKREVELTVTRQLETERAKVRDQAMRERDDEHRLKMADKDKQIADMQQKLEEARRTGDSTSGQLTGHVMETDLCDLLSAAFPDDEFERVKKGQTGGDVVQTVRNRLRQPCGKILWESKRTKCWSDPWLVKLREDQRAVKAEVAALATETPPEGLRHFDTIDGVWVTGFPTILPMASALRQGLIETANARRAAAGTGTVKDLTYRYLTGSEFRQRVRGALEPVIQLREQLDSEKRATHRRWGAQDKLLERFMTNMGGMYGDLQGIVGSGLPDVEGLMLLEHDDGGEKPKLSVVNSDVTSANDMDEEK